MSLPSRDELLDQAVVVGDLAELAVVQEVRARIADVTDEQRAAGRERPAVSVVPMPAQAGVGERLGEDGLVGVLDRLAQRTTAGDRGAQRLERGGAGHLTGPMTAHAVGDGDEPHRVVDEVGVLVAVAYPADVGGGPR